MFRDLDKLPQPEILPVSLTGRVNLTARFLHIEAVGKVLKSSPDIISEVFTPEEITYCQRYKVRPDEHFAVRLAAKLVIREQLGSDKVGWHDVSIKNNEYNAPFFVFSDNVKDLLGEKGIQTVHVSLSHEDPVAMAFCTLEGAASPPDRILRIGTDVCPEGPFQSLRIKRPTTFNEEEVDTAGKQQFPGRRLAMYYAAKESVVKVLETLPGWIWQEIAVHETEGEEFNIRLSGGAKWRLEQMGAIEIVTSLSYREGIGALAFSLALTESQPNAILSQRKSITAPQNYAN